MQVVLIALALIFGIYLIVGIVMLAIYAMLERRTHHFQSTFNPFLTWVKWKWYEMPLYIVIWPWQIKGYLDEYSEFKYWRKRYLISHGRAWNRYGG